MLVGTKEYIDGYRLQKKPELVKRENFSEKDKNSVLCVCVWGMGGSCEISQSVQMFKHRRDSVLVNVFAYLGCGRL